MNRILTYILLLSISANNFFQPFLVASDATGSRNTIAAERTYQFDFACLKFVGANNSIPINEDDNGKGNLEIGNDEDSYCLQDFFSIIPLGIAFTDAEKNYHFKLSEPKAISFDINTPPPEV